MIKAIFFAGYVLCCCIGPRGATNTNTILDYFGPGGLNYIPLSPATLSGWDGGTAVEINQA